MNTTSAPVQGAPTPVNDRLPVTSAAALLKRTKLRPTLGIVLGSGFAPVLQRATVVLEVNYADIPGFPKTAVAGHDGKLALGYLDKTPVVILSGRAHYYEGHSLEAVTFGVRLLAEMGIKVLMLTNAAGGIGTNLKPGDFMAITDHINFMGTNPLRGALAPGRHRFVDLSDVYNRSFRRMLQDAAKECKIRLQEGIYLAVSGPSYETPAEIRAYALMGADAVGMSTVPEAIVARQCHLKVAGISCITNLAAGRGENPLSHAEVLEVGKRVGANAAELLTAFARLYAQKK